MRKPFLKTPLPPFNGQDSREQAVRTYSFDLITPMIGGDSKSWELHPSEPVRGQSIRGQLRFWWRAMRSEQSPNALLQDENAIWGGKTEDNKRIQSWVKIAVLEQQIKKRSKAVLADNGHAIKGDVIPVYVGFPITSAVKKDKKDVFFIESFSFTLQVACPKDYWDSIEKVLTLWTLFGGVGARTRRGCGSLYCEELLKNFNSAEDINAFLKEFKSESPTKLAYPRLDGAVIATSEEGSEPVAAWKNLIERYARFRQDRRPGNPPGRSYWPEPDTIRIITRQSSPAHEPNHPDGEWFPRAAFGLPIIFKFNTNNNGNGDPNPEVELKPRGNNLSRWPSPLILKAVHLPGNKTLKAALVLNQAFPEALALKQSRNPLRDVPPEAHPFAPPPGTKCMKNRDGGRLLPDESIYQTLFRQLELEEL